MIQLMRLLEDLHSKNNLKLKWKCWLISKISIYTVLCVHVCVGVRLSKQGICMFGYLTAIYACILELVRARSIRSSFI